MERMPHFVQCHQRFVGLLEDDGSPSTRFPPAASFDPGFKLDLMKKDVNLALESARLDGVPLLLTSAGTQLFSAASTAGKGNADFSAAAQFVAGMAKVDLNRAGG